jgi:DNA modification methylase
MLLRDGEQFAIHHGDCIPHLRDMPPKCVDVSIFSPPFPAVFSYTDSPADLGNSEDLSGEGKLHFGFFFRGMLRVMKPGRVMMVHCWQIPRMKRSGGSGIFDFRGMLIRMGQRAGFIYDYDWLIPRNPQAQAIRTRSHQLQFAGLEADRARSRGALGDYLIKFVAPGDNAVPIKDDKGIVTQVSRNDWIQWAEAHWTGIKETDTLNVSEGRGTDDTKHICPLQLGVIDRLVRLYSNPDEIVFSPFTGIGSELYSALKRGRRAYGCELKDEYYAAAQVNCRRAIAAHKEEQTTMFDLLPAAAEGAVNVA